MSKSVTGSSIEGDKNYLQPFQISDVPPVASCVLSEKKKKINLNKRKEEEARADDSVLHENLFKLLTKLGRLISRV